MANVSELKMADPLITAGPQQKNLVVESKRVLTRIATAQKSLNELCIIQNT